jgi:hypothetical protein
MKKATQRKQDIALCYLLATGGRLPENLASLLEAIRALIPDLTESDLRAAIAWALRQAALLERKLRSATENQRAGPAHRASAGEST